MNRALTNESVDARLTADTREMLRQTKSAFYTVSTLPIDVRNRALETLARRIEQDQDLWLDENQKDRDASAGKLADSLFARLKLDKPKIRQVVQGVRDIAALPDPIGRVLSQTKLDDGLILDKVTVPLGVIAMVFESRPDVLPQIVSLALKSGNAVVLKGGRETLLSNHAFMKILKKVEEEIDELPAGWAQLIDTREDFHELLRYPEFVDLVIPRGSNQLVQMIMDSTQIPVLGHAEGLCHVYVHQRADIEKAVRVVADSKAQYTAICNATETLLVDEKIAVDFLPAFDKEARARSIRIIGCSKTREVLSDALPATDEDWTTEYLDLRLAVRVVDGLDEAVRHINKYGSHHTDTIITEDATAREAFLARVDSATVMSNASTRFADGFRFGLGAEVGISTLKTHARGPVGLEGLTIYKYVVRGEGQIVDDYVGENARPFLHEKL